MPLPALDRRGQLALVALALWFGAVVLWVQLQSWPLVSALLVLPAVAIGGWLVQGWRDADVVIRRALWSAFAVVLWTAALMWLDVLGWTRLRAELATYGTAAVFLAGLFWAVYFVERASQRYLARRRAGELPDVPPLLPGQYPRPSRAITWTLGLFLLVVCFDIVAHRTDELVPLPLRQGVYWPGAEADGEEPFASRWALVRLFVAAGAAGVLALVWARWAWRHPGARNPLDLDAWYYGRENRKLSQSLTTLASYSTLFLLAMLVLGQLGGCEKYELPGGGGGGAKQESVQLKVKIQKVVKKKFVINPFSAIIFNPPPIDEVKLQLEEITEHLYTIGQGQGIGAGTGEGSGFGGPGGKVRFIRLEYAGGDWDQDFGVGGDDNMLIWYGARTGQKVAEHTESRTITQLGGFARDKSPPVVYMTGQKNISLSKGEIKVLRDYLSDRHGMIFADNGGSGHWHNQFFSMMRQVLPNVDPVKIPLDDVIHRVPFALPFLPYVAPHGGREAWGWKVDGRWVAYYHPGDIGDAWTDTHSGVDAEVYESCYRLGANVIFYAHLEHYKWRNARQK